MATEQKWGRKESIIWPPRGFYYTWGAVFLAIVLTGFLVFLRFDFGLGPLERYYLPYYLRSGMSIRPTAKFQLLYVSDGTRLASGPSRRCRQRETAQAIWKATASASQRCRPVAGYRSLYREPEKVYQSKTVHLSCAECLWGSKASGRCSPCRFTSASSLFLRQLPFTLPKTSSAARNCATAAG